MKVYSIEAYERLNDFFTKNQDQGTYDNIKEWNEYWNRIDIDLYISAIKYSIHNKIPDSYIHEIQECFNYTNDVTLEITL